MSRKTKRVTIDSDNRDKGKTFVITELPADQAERWAFRVLSVLIGNDTDVPEDAARAGMAGFAAFGLKALGKMDFEVAKPLLDEMMACVRIDMGNGIVRDLLQGENGDIEEVITRVQLRKEVLELHLGFSMAVHSKTTE